jgi:hypothetical protein
MENERAFAELLNDCLDAMERGEASVQECLARHPQHAPRLEGLLRLGDAVRGLSLPAPAPAQLAAGEERLLQSLGSKAAPKANKPEGAGFLAALWHQLIEPAQARLRSWPKWALPALAISGSLALLFACLLAVSLGAGATWWAARNRDTSPVRSAGQDPSFTGTPATIVAQGPAQTPEMGAVQSPIASPEVPPAPQVPVATQPVAATQLPPATQTVATPDQGAEHEVFLPVLSVPLPPGQALLRDVRGVIEVQADGQAWAVASAEQILQAGERVRTGPLSGAQILFHDGSVAHLGPESELSIDGLGQDPADGARVIQLTQWAGESDHDVTPAYEGNARYEVHTPSGTGKALGTSFHVQVVPGAMSRFSVDDGSVAVIHLDVTVIVVAGQLTTVPIDRPPHEPFFRVTGEGEVTQVGEAWEIGGQVFATHDQTVIVGNPQVGDWVHVEGHLLPDGTRVADRIVLLRRAPENRFMIEGEVEAQETETDGRMTSVTIAGQEIVVGEETEVDEGIQVGDRVRAEGVIDENGNLLAESIRLIEEQGLRFSFVGVVQEIADTAWVVSGVPIAVDQATEIDEGLAVGDVVRVRGVFLEGGDGTWLAYSIQRVAPREADTVHPFEFVGLVGSIDPWVVSGIEIETRVWTEIKGEIELGDRVKVEGRILPDGTWLADEIKLADEDDGLSFEFVGRVRSVDPWVVGGISLAVDGRTEIKGEIEVGDRVKVEGRIMPDGAWLADEIKRIEPPSGRGCIEFTALVVRLDADQIVLQNGATIPLDGAAVIEGRVRVNSVIRFYLCIDSDGNVTIVTIIVLYQVEPAPAVRPTQPPSQDYDDDREDDDRDEGGERKVTICHHAQGQSGVRKTITVGWSAWINSHSKHGDTLGPCK